MSVPSRAVPLHKKLSKLKPSSGFPGVLFVRNQKRPMKKLSTRDPNATEINWKDLEYPETAALFCHDGCHPGVSKSLRS